PPRDPRGVVPRASSVAPVNTLGTVAFVLSIVGLVALPGVASIPALVCGIIALRREPKALAIVAIVLSAVEIVLVAGAIALWILTLAPLTQSAQNSVAEAMSSLSADAALDARRAWVTPLAAYGSIDEYLPAAAMPVDHWGNAMRAEFREIASGRCVLIWSAGADGVWESEDDFVAASEPRGAADELDLPTVD
ncbi:MAG: hypothetical protein ACKO0W_10860, partial [Planctomycetota bacterium]